MSDLGQQNAPFENASAFSERPKRVQCMKPFQSFDGYCKKCGNYMYHMYSYSVNIKSPQIFQCTNCKERVELFKQQ